MIIPKWVVSTLLSMACVESLILSTQVKNATPVEMPTTSDQNA